MLYPASRLNPFAHIPEIIQLFVEKGVDIHVSRGVVRQIEDQIVLMNNGLIMETERGLIDLEYLRKTVSIMLGKVMHQGILGMKRMVIQLKFLM